MNYKEILNFARSNRRNPTEAESFFWEKVRGRRLNGFKFNRQFIIEYKDVNGCKLFYIVDFHCFSSKLIVEVDGEIHRRLKEKDKQRQLDLEALGYKMVRFTNEEVLNQWKQVKEALILILNK